MHFIMQTVEEKQKWHQEYGGGKDYPYLQSVETARRRRI